MISTCHPTTRLVTVYEGCRKIVKRCPACSREYTQTKRRRANYPEDACYWMIPCDDHPLSGPKAKRVIHIDDDCSIEVERVGRNTDLTLINEGLHSSLRITQEQRQLLIQALQAL